MIDKKLLEKKEEKITQRKYAPTPYIRFVERNIAVVIDDDIATTRKIRILQQWFTWSGTLPEYYLTYGEWRDVPLEEE